MAAGRLGFVDIGRMGAPMAGRLIDTGYELVLFDTNAAALEPLIARGAARAGSPRELADGVETVLLSLPTPDVVERVDVGPDGLCHGSAVRRVIDTSTTGPGVAGRVGQALQEAGVRWIDSLSAAAWRVPGKGRSP